MTEKATDAGEFRQGRIIAVFQPQAWVNDYATEVDGRREVDVTDAVLRCDLQGIHALQNYRDSTDALVDTEKLGHDGPYTVQVTDNVCTYFGVKSLHEITQDHLVQVRSESGREVPEVANVAGNDGEGTSYTANDEASSILAGYVSTHPNLEPALTDGQAWRQAAELEIRARELGVVKAMSDETLSAIADGQVDMPAIYESVQKKHGLNMGEKQ